MDARDDALVKAAEFVLDAQAAAADGAVATIGQLRVDPGAVNVVPARVTLSVDARAPSSEQLAELVAAIGFEPSYRTEPVAMADSALAVKNTFSMNVEFYTGVDERLELPMLLPPVPDLVDFAEQRVLIADDVADTGATLALVKDFCEGKVAEVRCAVLYEKPRSTVPCEYVWRRTERWIDFPWSARAPVGEEPVIVG